MSVETRRKLVNDTRLVLIRRSQRDDLLDIKRTHTWLVQFLLTLLDTAKHPILVTALYSDHAAGTLHRPTNRWPDRG